MDTKVTPKEIGNASRIQAMKTGENAGRNGEEKVEFEIAVIMEIER
jgi:hypothetical protein